MSWKFSGEASYRCTACHVSGRIPYDDFSIECVSSNERQMGRESIWELSIEIECLNCSVPISIDFEYSEYPVEFVGFVDGRASGADKLTPPDTDYEEEFYRLRDPESIEDVVLSLQAQTMSLFDLEPREFEEVVAEIFKDKGFEVELTQRTRDGGKDIIAFSSDALGIKSKYFVECKRYAETQKIDIDVVRKLYGVMKTKDGPTKAVLVTTSTFTGPAEKFAKNEATSEWDIELINQNRLLDWISDYRRD